MTAQTYKELRALVAKMDAEGQHKAASMLSEYLSVKGKPRPRGRPVGR